MKDNISLKKLINFFLKGLLVTLPIVVTYKFVKSIVMWIDEFLMLDTPGLGFAIVMVSITLIGFLGSRIITKPFLDMLDELLSNIPFVKIIYTSVKDMIEAFVGEKKKFSKPVFVEVTSGVYKPGFITQEHIDAIDIPNLIAVYMPHSYAFSGNVFLVDRKKIHIYSGNSTDFMKFIVSGAVTNIEN